VKVLQYTAAGVLQEVQISSTLDAINYSFERFILNSSQTAAGVLELVTEIVPDSDTVAIAGLTLIKGTDYQVMTNALGNSEIQFLPPMLPGGQIPIEAGDEILVRYAYLPINPMLEFRKEQVILSGIDVANEYIDLSDEALELSTKVYLNGFELTEGQDYTVLLGTGTTRINFINQLASGGLLEIEEGDQVGAQYTIAL